MNFSLLRVRVAFPVLIVSSSLLFQNCSGTNASFSESILPSCNDVSADGSEPLLKWDWKAQFSSSPDQLFPTSDQVMAAPMVADLDGDKIPEVVFITFSVKSTDWYPDATGSAYYRNGVLRIVDGANGKNKKSIGSEALAPFGSASPLLVDIDRNGRTEIVYPNYKGEVVVLNFDGSLRWKHKPTLSFVASPLGFNASDVNNDGIAEFLVGQVLLTEDSQKKPKELFKATEMTNYMSTTFNVALNPNTPSTMSFVTSTGVFKANGVKSFGLQYSARFVAVADIYPEVAGLEIVGNGDEDIAIYNGLTGAVIRHQDLTTFNSLKCPSGFIGGGPVSIGDFDGDTKSLEIAAATGRYLTVFDKNAQPKYKVVTQDCSSLRTGLTSYDLNGDKKPEIIYADEEYLRIYEVVDGELQIQHQLVNPSGTLYEYPLVVDVNGDKTAEIVVASNNYAVNNFYIADEKKADKAEAHLTTGVRAFTSAEQNRWMPTRPIWGQYNFHPDQMTDNGQLIPNAQIDASFFRRNNQGYNQMLACRQ